MGGCRDRSTARLAGGLLHAKVLIVDGIRGHR